jgi:hypothetical protein
MSALPHEALIFASSNVENSLSGGNPSRWTIALLIAPITSDSGFGVASFGLLDLRNQAEVPSALRTDTRRWLRWPM